MQRMTLRSARLQHAPFAIENLPRGTEASVHRSRPTVLVIFAAVAACSTHDDARGTDLLSQDRTLVARIETDRETRALPLPSACGSVSLATSPSVANQTQAKELTLQAQGEEMQGNITRARALLSRASELDGTSKTTAYHLGRTNEALGDRAAALTAYCRYLALTPSTAESAEARQRVADLSKAVSQVSGGSVAEHANGTAVRGTTAPAQRVASARRTVQSRPATTTKVMQSAVATPRVRREVAPMSSDPMPASDNGDRRDAGSTVVQGDASATPDPAPAVDQPPAQSRSTRRGPTRAQGAMVGAATGAIVGAVAGRSVKGAVIGAAAGGLLGTMVGHGSRRLAPTMGSYMP
jgi:hypothetical protein